MALFDDLGITDPTQVNMKEQEASLAAGSVMPAGVHQAVLDGARVVMIDGIKRGYELKFRGLVGNAKDLIAEDVVWLPKGEDAKKDQKLKARGLMYGKRLGLITTTTTGAGIEIPASVPGKSDYCDCRGAIVMIDVVHEEETYEKDGKKRTINKAKLAYEGILKPDDKKCKDVPRLTSEQAKGVAASTPLSRPADSLADL